MSKLREYINKTQKHQFLFQGMVVCGNCGCAMVAEVKKGKYIYYHCTQNRGKCSGKCIREEVLDEQFTESLKGIRIDRDVAEWILKVLKEGHKEEERYFEERLALLQQQKQAIEARLKKVYLDRLDEVISIDDYKKFSAKFQGDLADIEQKIQKLRKPDRSSLGDVSRLLELSQKAAALYSTQNSDEKRKLLKIVHSNSSWKDGTLFPNYRKPFDLLAVTNAEYNKKKAASCNKSDLFGI